MNSNTGSSTIEEGVEELLSPQLPGTVGEALATPIPRTLFRRVASSLVLVGIVMLVLASLIFIFDGTLRAEFGVLSTRSIDLNIFVPYLLAAGIMFAICGLILLVFQSMLHRPQFSKIEATKRSIYTLLIKTPRFGITRKTFVRNVGLYVIPMAGIRDCYSFAVRGDFTQADLSGVKPSWFGAYDYEIVNGRLIIFYSQEAKSLFGERVRR